MGLLSPSDRVAETLDAGYELGTIFIEERRRGLEITTEEKVTVDRETLSVSKMHTRTALRWQRLEKKGAVRGSPSPGKVGN
jgi:hypothetical protein